MGSYVFRLSDSNKVSDCCLHLVSEFGSCNVNKRSDIIFRVLIYESNKRQDVNFSYFHFTNKAFSISILLNKLWTQNLRFFHFQFPPLLSLTMNPFQLLISLALTPTVMLQNPLHFLLSLSLKMIF